MTASRSASGNASQRLSSMQHRSMYCMSELDDRLEAAPEHALAVERHVLRVHELLPLRIRHEVLHDSLVDAVTLAARAIDDERKHDDLAALQLHAPGKRGPLADLDVIRHRLHVLERAVLHPDLAGVPRHAPVSRQLIARDRQHVSIHVTHVALLLLLQYGVLGHEGLVRGPHLEGPDADARMAADDRDRLGLVLRLEYEDSAQHFLGLGEGAVDPRGLAIRPPDGGRPGRVLKGVARREMALGREFLVEVSALDDERRLLTRAQPAPGFLIEASQANELHDGI